jgi:hypothetical protein
VTRNLFLARSYSGEASSPAGLTHGLSPLLSLRAQRSNLGISRDQTIEIASSPAAPRNDRGRARRVRSEGDQLPGDRLAVGDQSLVIDFDKTLARQHRAQCSISRAYCRWATTRSASAQAKSILSLKNVKYIERQVSTGWRRQWMIRASGSLRDRRSELFDRGSGARLGAGISHPTAPDRTASSPCHRQGAVQPHPVGPDPPAAMPELFRRLAQPAHFAQWTEIDPIGPGIARRVRGSWRGVCRAAALLEVTPAATRAGIIAAGSFGRRRSGGARHTSSEAVVKLTLSGAALRVLRDSRYAASSG